MWKNARFLMERAFAPILRGSVIRPNVGYLCPPDRRDNQASLRPDLISSGFARILYPGGVSPINLKKRFARISRESFSRC